MVAKALIFDVDGTIAETERDGHRVAFNQAFAAAGLDWDWSIATYGELLEISGGKERIRHYLEQYLEQYLEHYLEHYPEQHPKPEHYPPAIPQDPSALTSWIKQLHLDKSRRYGQILSQGTIAARPGVIRLIQEARSAGVRLAIATTSALDNALTVLQTALAPDAPDWFEVIAAGDIVATKKPDPAIYRYVLEQMQLNPQDCIVFEDSAQGVQAATGAGLPTIVTVNGYTHNHDFSGATWVLSDLGEPDQPCSVISGNLTPPYYVDLNRLPTP